MKNIITILLLLLSFFVKAQKSDAKIENLQLHVQDQIVFIHYDILNTDTANLHNIQLYFTDESFVKYYFPSKVKGDIGLAVKGGKGKCITWSISEDMDNIPQKITPHLRINDEKINFHDGGPSNAWLSMLVPGLGDYFVADHRNMKFKPYLRTITSYGLITLGIIASKNRTQMTKWFPPQWKEVNRKWKYFEGYYAEIGEYNYHFFRSDAEILIAAGISIWAIDVLWVAAKGAKNKKYKGHRKILQDIQTTSELSFKYGGLQLNYVINF